MNNNLTASIKWFYVGIIFWALPGIIPTAGSMYDQFGLFYEWAVWLTSVLAIGFFIAALVKLQSPPEQNKPDE